MPTVNGGRFAIIEIDGSAAKNLCAFAHLPKIKGTIHVPVWIVERDNEKVLVCLGSEPPSPVGEADTDEIMRTVWIDDKDVKSTHYGDDEP